jgi:hypothetical protein
MVRQKIPQLHGFRVFEAPNGIRIGHSYPGIPLGGNIGNVPLGGFTFSVSVIESTSSESTYVLQNLYVRSAT